MIRKGFNTAEEVIKFERKNGNRAGNERVVNNCSCRNDENVGCISKH